MAVSTSNSLQKMKIVGYKEPTFKTEVGTYNVQFNPTSFKQELTVEYVKESAPNSTDSQQRLKAVPAKKLNLTLTLDATGVSGQTGTTGTKRDLDITKEIEAFKKATYEYNGSTHDVPYVKISWGENKFEGRITSLNITHTLFNSKGNPIRSTLEVGFESSKEASKQAKENDKQSPDLTHVRTVMVGDTLPLMCQNIYNDSGYYLKVAQFNNLVDFRNLEPGTEIIFPPVI